MEKCLEESADGRARKEREAARREEELTDMLKAEDAKIQAEKDLVEAAQEDKKKPERETVDEEMQPQGEQSAASSGGKSATGGAESTQWTRAD